MSKNFELLMEVEKEFLSAPPESACERGKTGPSVPSIASADEDADREIAGLVQSVFLSVAGPPCRQVVFCGIDAANGSSSICARAARSLAARLQERVCLVDACPSSAASAGMFETSEPRLQPGSNLWLARWSGTREATKQPHGRTRAWLEELRLEFSYVLIDAPGCLVSDDAITLGELSDAVVLIIEADATLRQSAGKARHKLNAAGVRLAGTVLNNC